ALAEGGRDRHDRRRRRPERRDPGGFPPRPGGVDRATGGRASARTSVRLRRALDDQAWRHTLLRVGGGAGVVPGRSPWPVTPGSSGSDAPRTTGGGRRTL